MKSENSVEEHIIDCAVGPSIQSFQGKILEVIEHKKIGQMYWNNDDITLYQSPIQKNGTIAWDELQKELENQKILNANTLDFLLKYPDLIPDEWKTENQYFLRILFAGTIYRGVKEKSLVRYLYFNSRSQKWLCGIYFCSEPIDNLTRVPVLKMNN